MSNSLLDHVAAELWKAAGCPGKFSEGHPDGQTKFRELAATAIDAADTWRIVCRVYGAPQPEVARRIVAEMREARALAGELGP